MKLIKINPSLHYFCKPESSGCFLDTIGFSCGVMCPTEPHHKRKHIPAVTSATEVPCSTTQGTLRSTLSRKGTRLGDWMDSTARAQHAQQRHNRHNRHNEAQHSRKHDPSEVCPACLAPGLGHNVAALDPKPSLETSTPHRNPLRLQRPLSWFVV